MRRAIHLTIFLLAVCAMATGITFERAVTASSNADGVRFDLPANAALRVENRRGNVTVETWDEIYVWLETGAAGASVSPVRVERDEQRLTISTRRDETSRVDLTVRVPVHANVEIVTADGAIEIRGVPAALSATSEAGDVRLEVSPQTDATVTARSSQGSARNTLASDAGSPVEFSVPAREFTARLGAGNRGVSLSSVSGQITLAALADAPLVDASNDNATTTIARTQRRPPTLGGVEVDSSGASRTPSPSPTPSGSPEEVDEDDVITIETDLVNVNVSVVDRGSGRGLTGLEASDFRCLEDRVEQQIRSFEASSVPFDLILLIDLSGSTREVVDLIRASALRFVAAAREQDRIAVVTFASAPVLVSELTTDRAALRERIGRIEQPRGSTRLYDAVQFAMNLTTTRASSNRRSAIVLMSDGLDGELPNVQGDGSSLSFAELTRQVEEMDGVLYTLWLNTEYDSLSERDIQPETFDLAHDRMRQLAEAGGGVFHEVEELADLAGVYERVIADLGTVYSFSYRPTNEARDGRWRAIRVTLPRHQSAVARGRRGYRR